ncbi:MAG TPA: hypothetical protein DD727_06515, partial [Clostridiales bacterium]|nr:hypothetical protein [Clostridiales bacterium]
MDNQSIKGRLDLSFKDAAVEQGMILNKRGNPVWQIKTSAADGRVNLDRFDRLIFHAQTNGESTITLQDHELTESGEYVFHAGFILDEPDILTWPQDRAGPQLLFMSLDVKGVPYRIAYRMNVVSQMGWYLYDMQTVDYRDNPYTAKP